jgi:hypothetical protein
MKTADRIPSSSLPLSCNEMSKIHMQITVSAAFCHHISLARQNTQTVTLLSLPVT